MLGTDDVGVEVINNMAEFRRNFLLSCLLSPYNLRCITADRHTVEMAQRHPGQTFTDGYVGDGGVVYARRRLSYR